MTPVSVTTGDRKEAETGELAETDVAPLLADVLATLKRAAEALPESREEAGRDPNPLARQYRMGLVDGCEMTIERVVRIAQTYLDRAAVRCQDTEAVEGLLDRLVGEK